MVNGLGVDLIVDVVGNADGVEHVGNAGEIAERDHDGVSDDEGARAHVGESVRRDGERPLAVDDVMGRDER